MPPRLLRNLPQFTTILRNRTACLVQGHPPIAASIPRRSRSRWHESGIHTRDQSGGSRESRENTKHDTTAKATPRYKLESRPVKITQREIMAEMARVNQLKAEYWNLFMALNGQILELDKRRKRYWWPFAIPELTNWLYSDALEKSAPFWLPAVRAVVEDLLRLRLTFDEKGFNEIIEQEGILKDIEQTVEERRREVIVQHNKFEQILSAYLHDMKQDFFQGVDVKKDGTIGFENTASKPARH